MGVGHKRTNSKSPYTAFGIGAPLSASGQGKRSQGDRCLCPPQQKTFQFVLTFEIDKSKI